MWPASRPAQPTIRRNSTKRPISPSNHNHNNTMFIARRVFKRCRPSEEEEHEMKNAKPVSCGPSSITLTTTTSAGANVAGPPPMSPATQDSSTMFVDMEDSFDDEEDDMSSSGYQDEEEEEEEEASESASQSHMHRPAKRYRFDNMPFPEFSSAVEVTDSSSDEESVQQRDAEYQTKEDEDVAVFLNLTKRMSLQSLLHLLQGAARAQNNITDTTSVDSHPMMEYSVLLSGSRRSSKKAEETATADAGQQPGVVKQKKFRFAEISENRVREVVHPIESYKDVPGLWWTNEQMMEIRTDEIRVVKHFRKYRPQFIQSVETLVRANESPAVLEQHMRHLTEESFARGLETHSVLCIRERRKSHIAAVLQEQQDCRDAGDSYELASHCIREQSIAYSQQLAAFAFRMAKCDHIEALKASMSSWETPEAGVCA